MRKLIVIFLLVFVLSGCQNRLYIEEDTEAYQALSVQYDHYLRHDIAQDSTFRDFINQVTLETSTAGMKIEVRIFSSLGLLVEVKEFSGVVVQKDTSYHILTLYEPFIKESHQSLSISLSDYLGNTLSGELVYLDEALNLAMITTDRKTVHYEALEIKQTTPMAYEPLVLIGYQSQIINAITMGMLLPLDTQTDHTYRLSILSDDYGLGGAIVDTTFKLIGIQSVSHDDHTEMIKTEHIRAFYQAYLDQS